VSAKRKSKYVVVQDALLQWIRTTELAVGEQLPTEDDLAARFRVSRQTIRQAVGNLVTSGVLSREQGRGTFYRGEIRYRSPRKDSTKLVGVLVTYLGSYIFPHIIRGIEERLTAQGYAFVLQSTGNDHATEAQALDLLVEQGVDGLIVEPTRSASPNPNRHIYQELLTLGMPIVTTNASYDGVKTSAVLLDDVRGGCLATEHLIAMGHVKIGTIMKLDDKQGANRLQGMLAALSARGLVFQAQWARFLTADIRHNVAESYVEWLIANPPGERPSAVFCYNDEIAVDLISHLYAQDLKVPEDLSVVGYDDSDLARAVAMGLTTLVHPKVAMGERAAEIILQQIGHLDAASYIFAPSLVHRGTSVALSHRSVSVR